MKVPNYAAISLFSTFGPVAGFFCSGFKRGCNQKNFGCLIPGHGGVLDRLGNLMLSTGVEAIYSRFTKKNATIYGSMIEGEGGFGATFGVNHYQSILNKRYFIAELKFEWPHSKI